MTRYRSVYLDSVSVSLYEPSPISSVYYRREFFVKNSHFVLIEFMVTINSIVCNDITRNWSVTSANCVKSQVTITQSWPRRIIGMLTGQRGRAKAAAEINICKCDRECSHRLEIWKTLIMLLCPSLHRNCSSIYRHVNNAKWNCNKKITDDICKTAEYISIPNYKKAVSCHLPKSSVDPRTVLWNCGTTIW